MIIVNLILCFLVLIFSILGFYHAVRNAVDVVGKTITIYLIQFYYIFTSYFSMGFSLMAIVEIIKFLGAK